MKKYIFSFILFCYSVGFAQSQIPKLKMWATDLTNIAWSIALDGKLIFVGKAKSGTIASLAPGESVAVKDFVVGFGKTNIAVTAGTEEASAAGTVLLILVIGVA